MKYGFVVTGIYLWETVGRNNMLIKIARNFTRKKLQSTVFKFALFKIFTQVSFFRTISGVCMCFESENIHVDQECDFIKTVLTQNYSTGYFVHDEAQQQQKYGLLKISRWRNYVVLNFSHAIAFRCVTCVHSLQASSIDKR